MSETKKLEGMGEMESWFNSPVSNHEREEAESFFEGHEWEESGWSAEEREEVYNGVAEEVREEVVPPSTEESYVEGRVEWLREVKKSDSERQNEEG